MGKKSRRRAAAGGAVGRGGSGGGGRRSGSSSGIRNGNPPTSTAVPTMNLVSIADFPVEYKLEVPSLAECAVGVSDNGFVKCFPRFLSPVSKIPMRIQAGALTASSSLRQEIMPRPKPPPFIQIVVTKYAILATVCTLPHVESNVFLSSVRKLESLGLSFCTWV